MEDEARQAFLMEVIADPDEAEAARLQEQVQRYETAGRIGRWFIGRRYPRAAEHYDYLQALQSVGDARREAAVDPFSNVPLGAA